MVLTEFVVKYENDFDRFEENLKSFDWAKAILKNNDLISNVIKELR